MTRLLAFAVLILLLVLAIRRARALFLASPRGRDMLALWRLLRSVGGASDAARGAPTGARSSPGAQATSAGVSRSIPLVRCAACGTHVPEASALRRQWEVFCSEACEQRARS